MSSLPRSKLIPNKYQCPTKDVLDSILVPLHALAAMVG